MAHCPVAKQAGLASQGQAKAFGAVPCQLRALECAQYVVATRGRVRSAHDGEATSGSLTTKRWKISRGNALHTSAYASLHLDRKGEVGRVVLTGGGLRTAGEDDLGVAKLARL
jgi:hypothetical protein